MLSFLVILSTVNSLCPQFLTIFDIFLSFFKAVLQSEENLREQETYYVFS